MMIDTSLDNPLHHGGDTAWARTHFTYAGGDWLDLSTGINCRPFAVPDIPLESYHRLPQAADEEALKRAAAAYFNAPDADALVLAPGSQALIQWLPRLRPAGRVAIVGPTYAEHAQAWRQAGHHVEDVADLAAAENADVVVVVNPNNPDGRLYDPTVLTDLADMLARRGGWLVVDEAFADVTPDHSLAPAQGRDGMIVLRSFGKFFGLAGIRLGIALCPAPIARDLSQAIGRWAVAGPSSHIARQAYEDHDWQQSMRRQLAEDALRMDALLTPLGGNSLQGTTLYRLLDHDRARDLFHHLGENGIMVRQFPYNPRWLRFGLPGPESDWQRLENALAGWGSN